MKLGIVGSRKFDDKAFFIEKVLNFAEFIFYAEPEYVTGDCPSGADAFCRELIEDEFVTVHKADWNTYGKSAGPKRNQKIIDDADELIAFLVEGQPCKGTRDSIRKAEKKGIPIHIYTQKKG
jgi:hypothetical protein